MIHIKNWIICILIGAFIVNIVDMVLPESKLKPYINLVCNFIFIFIVISPIVSFLSSGDSLEDKLLKSMNNYNEKYVETNKDLADGNNNFDLNKEYQNNLKTVLQLKLDEYGYELEDIDFDGTDIESLKIKEKDNQNNLNLSNQKNNSESKENNTDKNNNTNQNKSSEVFRNSTINKTQNEKNLKNDLIKILEVSIDKIEID
ncbi:MAG: stage III sporulation protein AF [Intestinibacter bartlettii]|uniref:stage III sporulation protein AF n=1 Tax=Intestinibacter bartlettii TaxID=261299 RepID=UPI0024318FD7|nr:stage III sporulation protein AF [Intestinibacter bartlettii]MBS7147601.1 stage III sporulation protein AF [Intestinibacter bartlettii]